MNSFEQSRNLAEIISQIIDNLTFIKDKGNLDAELDRQLVLENLREAYMAILKAPLTDSIQKEAEQKQREEQERRQREEQERRQREEQERRQREEQERRQREEQERRQREEQERRQREEQERRQREEQERIQREEQERIQREASTPKQPNGQSADLFDIFAPVAEAKSSASQPQPQAKRSLNDLLHERNNEKQSLYSKIQDAKIEDLAKAISLNDKFLFIKELFKNQGEDFSRAIRELNQCHNLEEAFEKMEKMKKFYLWDSVSPAYLSLCDLVRRRFS